MGKKICWLFFGKVLAETLRNQIVQARRKLPKTFDIIESSLGELGTTSAEATSLGVDQLDSQPIFTLVDFVPCPPIGDAHLFCPGRDRTGFRNRLKEPDPP